MLSFSILEEIIQPQQDEHIVQTSPDKIPSFISLEDDKPGVEEPYKPKPQIVSEDKPKSLVNGKPEHAEPSKKAPFSEFDVTIPLTEGESPVTIVQKPVG